MGVQNEMDADCAGHCRYCCFVTRFARALPYRRIALQDQRALGLRHRESQPVCRALWSSGGSHRNRRISAARRAGVQESLYAYADRCSWRTRLRPLPRPHRVRRIGRMVHLLRNLAGNNFSAELADARYGDREYGASLAKDDLRVRSKECKRFPVETGLAPSKLTV